MNIDFRNWNLPRILRMVLGMAAMGQGIFNSDTMLIVAGGLIAAMGLFNFGCCGPAGCAVKPVVKKEDKKKEVSYEEVVEQ